MLLLGVYGLRTLSWRREPSAWVGDRDARRPSHNSEIMLFWCLLTWSHNPEDLNTTLSASLTASAIKPPVYFSKGGG